MIKYTLLVALLVALLVLPPSSVAAIALTGGDSWREARMDAITLGDNAGATQTVTFDGTGTDVVLTVTSGTFNVSTGTIQQAGTPVVLESRTITGGNGIVTATMGDLSTDRTVTIQLIDAADGVGATTNQSGMEFGDAGSDELGLLQGCTDQEILKWINGTTTWDCMPDVGASAIDIATPEELTIATGVVTSVCPADNICAVDIATEGGAGTDDLDTFNCTLGAFLIVKANVTTNTVVMKAQSADDVSLDSTEDYVMLACDTANLPEMVSRHNGG